MKMKMKTITAVLTVLAAVITNVRAQHTLPPLPYAEDGLQPVMSAETIRYHHGKHVQGYVDNLNRLIPGTPYADASLEEIVRSAEGKIFNNGAQIYNHILFFNAFAPEIEAKHRPEGPLAEAIVRDFVSFDNFKQEFTDAAADIFGSGWAWLASDAEGKLHIITTSNAGNPLRDGYVPLLGIDVWEHSYYIDYRNDRKDYLNNLWRIVDWSVVEKRQNP